MATEVIALLLGAGGAGGVAGLVNVLMAWRKGRLESEEHLIARLNADSRQQGERADRAEQELEVWRRRAHATADAAWRLRRMVIDLGGDPTTVKIPNGH